MNGNYALSVIDYGPRTHIWHRSKPYDILTSLNKICNPLLTNIQNNLPLGIHIYSWNWLRSSISHHASWEQNWYYDDRSMSFNDILALYNLSKFISKCKLNNIQCKPIFYFCKGSNKCCLDYWVIIKGKILHDLMHANPTNCLLM